MLLDILRRMILLVEDEAITRNALADTLKSEGHKVIQAADGNKALALLQKSRFDLVITDLLIPNQSGFVLVATVPRRSRTLRPLEANDSFLRHTYC